MHQVRIHAPQDARVDEVAEPTAGPRDAVLRVAACGICGSDLSFLTMGPINATGEPMPLGHEMAGEVISVGAEVTGFAEGDHVVVLPGNDDLGRIGCGMDEGGMAPLLLVREADRRLFRAPAGVDLATAALVEPIAVGMNAANQAAVTPDQPVAVFGCGPVGLAAIATFADRGHTQIVGVDVSAARRELALTLGATHVLDPAADQVWARLGDLHGTKATMLGPTPATAAYVEATGVATVVTDLVNNAGPGSTIVIVAVHGGDLPISGLLVMMRELTIRGAMEYPARYEDAIELMERRDVSAMVTHRFDVTEFGDAIEMLQTSKECGKVLITFSEEA
jgi:threonine dehydrogenase-like Zn-dependent dehydrogenase